MLRSRGRMLRCLLVVMLPVCAGVFVTPAPACADGKTEIRVGFWGPGSYECSTDEIAYFVGGTYGIRTTLWPFGIRPRDIEYAGISDWTWPAGLEISVAQLSSPTEPFQPSAALRDRLHLEYYVTATLARQDSLWRAGVLRSPRVMTAPEYHFSFQVPPELAGSYLCISVTWNHPKYGHLATGQPICTRIVSPCSQMAQHEVWTSQVMVAEEQMNYELAVGLADSFVALGWHEIYGLQAADNAARHLGHYDDAIRFLDICFEWNHTIEFLPDQPLPSAPTEESRRLYEQNRSRLIELKSQREQQQPQH